MSTTYALILAGLLALFPAYPADAREWRSWCGAGAGASPPLGWHFYCDRSEETEDEAAGNIS